MPRFLLHHGLVGGLGPDQSRLQGNLLRRKDWIQLRKIALSEWVLLPIEGVAAYPWCTECEHLRSGICLEERRAKWAHVWLVAVESVRKQGRWPLHRTSGQRLGTRTLAVTPGRTRSLWICSVCPWLDSFFTSSPGPPGTGLEVLSHWLSLSTGTRRESLIWVQATACSWDKNSGP